MFRNVSIHGKEFTECIIEYKFFYFSRGKFDYKSSAFAYCHFASTTHAISLPWHCAHFYTLLINVSVYDCVEFAGVGAVFTIPGFYITYVAWLGSVNNNIVGL